MNRKSFAFASLLIVVIIMVAACGPTAAPTEPPPPAPTEGLATEAPEPTVTPEATEMAPSSELANTLVIAENEHPFTFDPIFGDWTDIDRIAVLAYEALVRYKPGTTEVTPWLAKEWTISDDGLTYTFKLNEGVKFHDGTDLTASDVKFTLDRLVAINDGMAYALDSFESAEVLDDYTIAIKLTEPAAPFLADVPKFYIVSEDGVKAHDQDGDWAQSYLTDHDLGSGPYMLTRHVPEQQAVFEKFEDYWQGWDGNHVDRVIWLYVKESTTQRLMLEAGEIDIAMDPAMDDLADLDANPDLQVIEGASLTTFLVHFRVTHPPLDDVRVRKALSMAFDYDGHIAVALAGHGKRAQGPLASGHGKWHNDEVEMPSFDLDGARALLAEAGYPDGGFTLKIAYESGQDEKVRALELYQANLEQLGITVESMGMDWMTQADLAVDETSEPDVHFDYSFPGSPDPAATLRKYYHSEFLGIHPNNLSWYMNPEVDKLLDEGTVETDPAKREEIYKQVQQIINDDQPSFWVSEMPYMIAARNYVEGYVYSPANHQTVWAYDIWLEGKP